MEHFDEPHYPPSSRVSCQFCKGTGKDPRKRTRKCPECGGRGTRNLCKTCGELQPCDCVDQTLMY